MVDRRREQDVNEAAARFAETLADSYRIVYEQAADAQQRPGRPAHALPQRAGDPRRARAGAAARVAETLAHSEGIVYEQAADAQQRRGRLAQDFSERVMDHLREQAEGGRAASERLTDQARRQQEAGQAFAQESAKAYMDFLDTAFSRYREGTQRAAGGARDGARTA